ncbi:hypothetical protein [Nocardia mikamii]|uniref:hypothetical protein n=1 Tax=Nocardia mikamii TaxID=508464 RepID=UPI0012F47AF0|nr:hypothetical protein [Nocardia mikamii]
MTTLRTDRDLAADIRVRSLLSAAVGGGEARLDAVMRRYRDDPATALLAGREVPGCRTIPGPSGLR